MVTMIKITCIVNGNQLRKKIFRYITFTSDKVLGYAWFNYFAVCDQLR